MTLCRICGAAANRAHSAVLLGRYQVAYWFCSCCGYLFTDDPYWLDDAYAEPIASLDTGIVERNLTNCRIASRFLMLFYGRAARSRRYLDFAGGTGLFTRLMRDREYDFRWADPHAHNLFARGFGAEVGDCYDLITAFEVLEHLSYPREQIGDFICKYKSDHILFSTETFLFAPPSPDWWYYTFSTGQHVSFYRPDTLSYLAARFQFEFVSFGGFHLFTRGDMRRASRALYMALLTEKLRAKFIKPFHRAGFIRDFHNLRNSSDPSIST